MIEKTQFVAIPRDDAAYEQTFVVDGNITINSLWEIINDRLLEKGGFAAILGKGDVRHVSLYRDEAARQTNDQNDQKFYETMSGIHGEIP